MNDCKVGTCSSKKFTLVASGNWYGCIEGFLVHTLSYIRECSSDNLQGRTFFIFFSIQVSLGVLITLFYSNTLLCSTRPGAIGEGLTIAFLSWEGLCEEAWSEGQQTYPLWGSIQLALLWWQCIQWQISNRWWNVECTCHWSLLLWLS